MKYLGDKSISSAMYTTLTVFWYGAIAVTLILTGFAVAIATGLLGDPDNLELKVSGLRMVFSPELLQSYRWLALPIFSFIPGMGAILFIIYQLRLIFGTLIDRNPFGPENPKRIRNIGFSMFVLAGVKAIAELIFNRGIIQNLQIPGTKLHSYLHLDISTILAGLIILALSEVFRLGFILKEEHDLTV